MLMQQKKFVKFGLNTNNFQAYMPMIEEETLQLIKTDPAFSAYHSSSRSWGRFHSFKSMSELTILTASRTLQGDEVRSKLTKDYAQVYNDLDGGFTPLNFMFPSLPLPSYRRRDKAQEKMSRFYQDIIKARREGKSEHEHDILAALQDQKYRDGRALNDVEMAHIMIALLMAGQHTSSATSSWTLLHIADRPDVQQALYDEQVKHFGTGNGKFKPMEYEDIKDLPLLDAVIRETLRCHPPLHSLMVRSSISLYLYITNCYHSARYYKTSPSHNHSLLPLKPVHTSSPKVTSSSPHLSSPEWTPTYGVIQTNGTLTAGSPQAPIPLDPV